MCVILLTETLEKLNRFSLGWIPDLFGFVNNISFIFTVLVGIAGFWIGKNRIRMQRKILTKILAINPERKIQVILPMYKPDKYPKVFKERWGSECFMSLEGAETIGELSRLAIELVPTPFLKDEGNNERYEVREPGAKYQLSNNVFLIGDKDTNSCIKAIWEEELTDADSVVDKLKAEAEGRYMIWVKMPKQKEGGSLHMCIGSTPGLARKALRHYNTRRTTMIDYTLPPNVRWMVGKPLIGWLLVLPCFKSRDHYFLFAKCGENDYPIKGEIMDLTLRVFGEER